MKLPFTDFKSKVNSYTYSKWQSAWTITPFNKLREVKPTLGEWHQGNRSIRREEVVLSRCRIGHTRLTHSYLLKRNDQPECIPCQEPLTVKHILIDCVDFALQRNKYYSVQSLEILFQSVPVENIIAFLKEIGIFCKL